MKRSYSENRTVDKESQLEMDPQKIDVIKVQETFHRLSINNPDKFETYQKYVLSFCLVYIKNSNFDKITLDLLNNLLKDEPDIKCGVFYKYSKVYRLFVIVSDAQELIGEFCDRCDCLDRKTRLQNFWSRSVRPFWSILKLKYSAQAHWFNDLEC